MVGDGVLIRFRSASIRVRAPPYLLVAGPRRDVCCSCFLRPRPAGHAPPPPPDARVCAFSPFRFHGLTCTQVGLGRGRLEEGNARPHSVHISNTRTPQPRGTRLRGRPCRRRLRRNDDTPRYRAPTTPPPSVTSVPSPPSTYFAPT